MYAKRLRKVHAALAGAMYALMWTKKHMRWPFESHATGSRHGRQTKSDTWRRAEGFRGVSFFHRRPIHMFSVLLFYEGVAPQIA